jgi:polysaccharide biosynthesis transport protein
MDDGIQLSEVRGIIRRRWKSFIIVFFPVVFIAAFIALALPPSYVSQATILVESQQIPEAYVRSAITTYVEERLDVITQQVLSQRHLQEIIDEFGLYSDYKDKYLPSEIIELVRNSFKYETISSTRAGSNSSATVAFTISYEGEDPATVQKVTNKFASLYLTGDINLRQDQVANTTSFLEQSLAQLQSQIDEIQEKISVLKTSHYGELPENSSTNLSAMQNLERQLDQNNSQIVSLRERKIYLEGQLATIAPMASVTSSNGTPAMSTQERLRSLKSELASLKTIYTSSHPDVVRIENMIKQLESEAGASGDNSGTGINNEGAGIQEPDNPAYINLNTQIRTTEMDIENLLKDEKTIKAQISVYQKRLENAPNIEKEYNNLTRDYENAKNKYNDIMNKLLESRVAQGMEDTQKGEKFTMIDNAQLPEKPNSPNRAAIALIGFVLAIGGGIGLAAFQETTDDSFKSSGELSRFIKAPVLSVMPVIVSDEDKQRGKKRWALTAAVALCVLLLAIVLVHLYVMPIEMLVVKIQHRMMGG